MYEVCTSALGGQMVLVQLGGSFELDPGAIAAALSPSTRSVFLTNPHNPSGRAYPLDTFTALVERIRPVTLFVDEAYADFSGESLIARGTFASHPNLVVGRTFSKSYGMAGLRVGAVLAAPRTLEPLRQVVPPYSLNAWAAAALPIAIHDHAYREWYCAQAAESRALLGEACARLALPTWPSAANFVLVRIGAGAQDVVRSLALRGVLVRDRSSETGCEGCIRITAGVVDDTRRVIAALEEVLCGAQ
jgi:histidinol-phosphate aminotransferase